LHLKGPEENGMSEAKAWQALDVAREWLKRKRMSTAEGIVWIEDRAPTGGIGFLPGQREHESLAALIESERAEAYRDGFEAAREMAADIAQSSAINARQAAADATGDGVGWATGGMLTAEAITRGIHTLRPPAEAKEPGR
jgi:hypothetical protein